MGVRANRSESACDVELHLTGMWPVYHFYSQGWVADGAFYFLVFDGWKCKVFANVANVVFCVFILNFFIGRV